MLEAAVERERVKERHGETLEALAARSVGADIVDKDIFWRRGRRRRVKGRAGDGGRWQRDWPAKTKMLSDLLQ